MPGKYKHDENHVYAVAIQVNQNIIIMKIGMLRPDRPGQAISSLDINVPTYL